MSWNEARHLREQLEKVTEERDRYVKLYRKLFGLLVSSDNRLQNILFGDDTFDPTRKTEDPEKPEKTEDPEGGVLFMGGKKTMSWDAE